MNPIQFFIHRPVVVLVGVILVVLFGVVALLQIPYQLAPRVEKPIVTVRTFWNGASPYEIERDIIEVQERALKGLPNLLYMESESRDNMGFVSLTFDLGISMADALLRVSNKLDAARQSALDGDSDAYPREKESRAERARCSPAHRGSAHGGSR